MADYSNLFSGGGGVSSSRHRRNSSGSGKIVKFIILILLIILGFWLYRKFNSSKDVSTDKSEITIVNETNLNSDSLSTSFNKSEDLKNRSANSIIKKTISSLPSKKMIELQKNYKTAEDCLSDGELVLAVEYANKIINSDIKEDNELWEKAAIILGDANIKIFMSDIPTEKKQLYTIKSGDSLIRIAKNFKTTVDSIQTSNGLNPASPIIFPGKTLYIYTGSWNIKVNKKNFKLYLYDGDELFKIYSIGIGKQGRTPSGTFKVHTKQKEPTWYNEGRAISYGSKENVLGTRWMSLKPSEGTNQHLRGYGIHGTWEPETVGTKSSNGCIRMKNDDVNELYSIIPYRTEVIIEDK